MITNFKAKVFRSAKYRVWVASHYCCVCGRSSTIAPHHHQEPGTGIMGGKVGDDNCVPLCIQHHNDVHQIGRICWEHWGVKPKKVAERLYAEYQRLS